MQDKEEITAQTRRPPIDVAQVIEYRQRGLTLSEISKILGCSKSNIYYHLEKVSEDVDALPVFKKHRADLLAMKGRELYNSLDAEAIAKASLSQRVVAFGILTDKERMERGETTHNIGIADFTRRISDIDRELAQLEAEVGHDQE